MSRQRFLELGFGASAGLVLLGGVGCHGATRRGLKGDFEAVVA